LFYFYTCKILGLTATAAAAAAAAIITVNPGAKERLVQITGAHLGNIR